MARRALLTPADAEIARQEILRQLAPDYEPTREDYGRRDAAKILLQLFATQERYALEQSTPADYARAANNPKTRAAQHERLTADDVYDLQAKLAGDYPGKPA